jgi:hypothetical protein
MSVRLLFAGLTLIMVVICLSVLVQVHRSDSLLGLWDSGRFSSRVMPEPHRIPDEQLARLGWRHRISFQPSTERRQGETLEELFKWYDLDRRYVDATVNTEHLDPTHVPQDPFDVVLINEN